MKIIDLNSWNRKEIYEHFIGLTDPFVAVVVELDVTKAYETAKASHSSFFQSICMLRCRQLIKHLT